MYTVCVQKQGEETKIHFLMVVGWLVDTGGFQGV